MNLLLDPMTFPVPLTLDAHHLAQTFRQQQANPRQAKQVYLNTLCVWAVNQCLQSMGIETDWESSHSHDPIRQALSDCADLVVANMGKLECRPVLPGASTVHIPMETWPDRMGYIAVQLDAELRVATLLGFVPQVNEEDVAIAHFHDLAPLWDALAATELTPASISDPAPALITTSIATSAAHQFSTWLQNALNQGWQTLDDLIADLTTLGNPPAFARGGSPALLPELDPSHSVSNICCAKLIELGLHLQQQRLVIEITLTPDLDASDLALHPNIIVQLKLLPAQNANLPADIQFCLLDETGQPIPELETTSEAGDDWLQLAFTGETGDRFSFQITYAGVSFQDAFTL
jgi:Protein of unknown function (DUF1822)